MVILINFIENIVLNGVMIVLYCFIVMYVKVFMDIVVSKVWNGYIILYIKVLNGYCFIKIIVMFNGILIE